MVTTPRYPSSSHDPGSLVVIASPRAYAASRPPGTSTTAATDMVTVVTVSASWARDSGAPAAVETAYAVPEPRAATMPRAVSPGWSPAPPTRLTSTSPSSAIATVRTSPDDGARRRWTLPATRSSTGANPRLTTVPTLTPASTTATKKRSWKTAVATPVTTTRRPWLRTR